MRQCGFFAAVLLALCSAGGVARAEELPNAPGWSMSRFTDNQPGDDNTYGDGRVYFSLKPPDARPAITIDTRTAGRLRSGEANAEATYGGQAAANGGKKEEEFVYGNHGNGIAMAEPVNSTLTAEEGRKDSAPASGVSGGSSLSGIAQTGGLPGFSSSGGSDNPGSFSRAPAGQHNASGASAPPPGQAEAAAKPAGASGGGSPTIVDPRAIAVAQARALELPTSTSTDTAVPTGGGITVKNGAAGFGMATSTGTNFSVWPSGDPATTTATSTETSVANSTVVAMNQTVRPIGSAGEYCEMAIFPTTFTFHGYDDCMAQLSSKVPAAEGAPMIPESLSIDGYCRREFPSFNGRGYAVNARLYVRYRFQSYETCNEDVLSKLPSFGAKLIIPGRELQSPTVASNAMCRDQFPFAPPAPNPPPVVKDESGNVTSGPATCDKLSAGTVFFCYDSRTVDKGDPGSFGGYQNLTPHISQADCQSWCNSYGLKGVCIYGHDKAPCAGASCRFWPEDLCKVRGATFQFFQVMPFASPDEVPGDTYGAQCK